MSDGDYRQIMYVRDGGVGEQFMVVGTVADLAKEMQNAGWADYEVNEVFGLNQVGDLKPLQWRVADGVTFDQAQYAYPKVTVDFPDGHRESAFYQVDGTA